MSDLPHCCFVSDTLQTYFGAEDAKGTGGAERQQYMIATHLSKSQYEVSVAGLNFDDNNHTVEEEGVTLWRIIPNVRGVSSAPYKAIRTLLGLRQIDADIYYVRGNDLLCVITALYCKLFGAIFVYGIANDANIEPTHLSEKGLFRIPYLKSVASANTVVAQTKHQQNLLFDEHGIEAVHIPNGYDVPSSSEIIPHEEREYVLWVGSMDPHQKKPLKFVELASRLPEIEFKLIGPPDNDNPAYASEVEMAATKLTNLEYVGYVHPDQIHDYYKRASLLVNTSEFEGFPNTFLEAWRYATPVLSLHFTLDDTLREKSIGWHAGSMNRLTELVEEIQNDPACRGKVGSRGRTYLGDKFSFDDVFERYEDLFCSLYNKKQCT